MHTIAIWYEILVELTLTAPPILKYDIRTAPFFLRHHGSRQSPLSSGRTAVGTLFQTEYPPPPPPGRCSETWKHFVHNRILVQSLSKKIFILNLGNMVPECLNIPWVVGTAGMPDIKCFVFSMSRLLRLDMYILGISLILFIFSAVT